MQRKFSNLLRRKNFFLLNADAVKNPTGLLPDSVEDFAVVANLPYSISSPWLESLLNSETNSINYGSYATEGSFGKNESSLSTKNYSALTIFLESVFEYKKKLSSC